MLIIDGSYHEGGGQILRTALTLSLATRAPFRIDPDKMRTIEEILNVMELRLGVEEIEHLSDPTGGELRVAVATPLAAGILPVIVSRMTRRYPRIASKVFLNLTRIVSDRLQRMTERFVAVS
jgi:hypothetical protein